MSQYTRLLEILSLDRIDEFQFEGGSLDIGSPQIYGGQVLAQSLRAAYMTIRDDKTLHSLHGYFLSPGDMSKKIRFQVELIKDGRSFDTRRVKAIQGDRVIFLMAASYHIDEQGYEHQMSMPNVAQPETLSSFPEIFKEVAEKLQFKPKGIYSDDGPVIFHPVEHYNPLNPSIRPALTHAWFRFNGDPVDDLGLRQALIAYASDFNLLITSLFPHAVSLFTQPMRIASLDHAMWFHRPWDGNDWMLYVVESPSAGGARGFCTGKIYSRQGDLLCSVTQEGLIRRV